MPTEKKPDEVKFTLEQRVRLLEAVASVLIDKVEALENGYVQISPNKQVKLDYEKGQDDEKG